MCLLNCSGSTDVLDGGCHVSHFLKYGKRLSQFHPLFPTFSKLSRSCFVDWDHIWRNSSQHRVQLDHSLNSYKEIDSAASSEAFPSWPSNHATFGMFLWCRSEIPVKVRVSKSL